MARTRWVSTIAITAAMAALPACAFRSLSTNSKHGVPSEISMHADGRDSEFAVYPRAPGERVAHHPNASEALPQPNPVPPNPPDSQSTQPIESTARPDPLPPIDVRRLDPPLVAAVRDYLADRPDLAVEHLKQLDPPNQELLLQLIPVLVRASQTGLTKTSPHEIGVMKGELDGAAATLAPQAPLAVGKTCFCRAVRMYGQYEPFPDRYAFRPGSLVWLYAEVRNVPNEPAVAATGVEGFTTKLACTLEIKDVHGQPVGLFDGETRQTIPVLRDTKEEFTRSPVQDYFIAFRIPMPPAPGDYRVTFEIRDPKTGRAVSQTTPFRVQ